jgi:uncharacterized membrane protein
MLVVPFASATSVGLNDSNEQSELANYQLTFAEPTTANTLGVDGRINDNSDNLPVENTFQPKITQSQTNNYVLKTIQLPVKFTSPKISNRNGYSTLDIPDTQLTGAPGMPELNTRILNFKFDPGTKFQSIEFNPGKINIEPLAMPIKPVQEPIMLSLLYQYKDKEPEQTPPDPVVYSQPELYPPAWFEVNTGMGIDSETGKTKLFMKMNIYPSRFLPAQNQLNYITEGTVTIRYTPPTKTELNQLLYGDSLQSFQTSSRGASIAENYELLIISPVNEQTEQNLTRLVDFKTLTNMPAKLVNISAIVNPVYFPVQGRDTQEKIKYFIYNAKKTWNITYVILAGDAAQIPHRNVYITGSMAGDVPADMYYADLFDSLMNFCNWDTNDNDVFGEYNGGQLDGTDMYPDVYLGRLPADNAQQMELLVDRIIYYESTATGQPWFDNVTMCGTNTFSGTSVPEGEYSCEYIADNYLDEFVTTKLYETTTYARDLPLTTTNVVNTLNQGSGFATFHDHGAPQSWAGVFSSANAQSLTNGDKLPFLNFDACSTGRFDDQDSITEKVVLNPNGGSIISIGASRIGWGAFGPNHINSNSGYFNVHLYDKYYNGEGTVGRIFDGSKVDYLDFVGINSYHDYMTLTEYTLFGDPSLSVGGIPLRNITISCDDNTSYIAPTDSVQYQVTLENDGVLSKPIKLYLDGIPENWTATLNQSLIILPAKSQKSLSLTVTAADLALYDEIAHIEVYAHSSKNKARTISVTTHSITTRIYGLDLDTFTLDAAMYPGENVSFGFQVFNQGNAEDIVNLSAALKTPTPGWEFDFSVPDPIVPAHDYQFITVKITSPEQTLLGTYEVDVTGSLIGLQANDVVTYQVDILRTYGIDMESEVNLSQKINPAENDTYPMRVYNLGNYFDKVQFTIQRAPKTWDIQLSRPKPFRVEAYSSKIIELFIDVPEQTEVGYYVIRLRANLVSNSTNWVELEYEIFVNRVYDFDVSIAELDVTAEPGETKEFNLTIEHLGNGDDVIELEIVDKPRDWYINYSTMKIDAAPFIKTWAVVRITPHIKSVVDRYPIKLHVTLAGNQQVKVFGINISVKPIDGFELSCLNNRFEIEPGDTQNYRIYFNNYGNHLDEITVNVTKLDESLEIAWTPEALPNENIMLGPFNSTIVTIKILTDSDAIAGTYVIPVTAILKSTGEEKKIYLYLEIKPFYGVDLESEDKIIRTQPGEDFTITINITNNGNIKDNITRVITGIPVDWDIIAPRNYTYPSIGPYSTKTEIIRIRVPENEEELDLEVNIRVYSGGRPDLDKEKKSEVYVEQEPKSEPVRDFNWGDTTGLFFYWILPIILIIIVIAVMAFIFKKQRDEYKDDMEIIKEMQQKDTVAKDRDMYDYPTEEDYISPKHSAPSVPGTMPMKGKGARSKVEAPPPPGRKTKHKVHPGTKKGTKIETKHAVVGEGEKMRWLDDKPTHGALPSKKKKSKEKPGEKVKWLDEEKAEVYGDEEHDLGKIECTECGKKIGIDEYKCPYCGAVFEEFGEVDESTEAETEEIDIEMPDDDTDADVEFELAEDEEFELDESDADEVDEELDDEEIAWELEE